MISLEAGIPFRVLAGEEPDVIATYLELLAERGD